MSSKSYSQHEEQDIITDLLRKHQIKNTAVEIGINTGAKGNGTTLQGNTVFLKERGWTCLWMDANTVYNGVKKVLVYPENIDSLVKDFGDIGIFSIDIDSEDWYVVRELLTAEHRPDMFVCETNSYMDPMDDLVMPLGHRRQILPKSICHGATLQAFDNLLSGFGYNFVCTTRLGNNGFWIREDIRKNKTPISDYKNNRHPLTTNWSRPNHTDVWTSSRELLA
jgi:hypothetical protein